MSHDIGPLSPEERISARSVPGFECTDFRQPANLSISKHAHPTAILLFVLGGNLIETYSTHSFEHSAGTVVFRPAGETHQHEYGRQGARCLAVSIQDDILQEGVKLRRLASNLSHLEDESLITLGFRVLSSLRKPQSFPTAAVQEILYEALGSLSRMQWNETCKYPSWLMRAREIIFECFLEDLSIDRIAASVGVHPIYLAGTFRRHYGSTIAKTIRNLRLSYALNELTRTETPLTELALRAGFFDHSHFAHFIKQQTGMPPSELRKMIGRRKHST